ncbi:MAG TPA: glycosyltransferase family 1 protein [Solirubrobacteraceae bacterium]|jgi:glycosyltransferase involved in cell wall biosynthesis|nr:glycosyltransferase family 1 protein [Solirubrobacteraceae bacterium]
MPSTTGDNQRPLTIGIDARAATEVVAGRGRVVRELLRAFAARDDPHRYRCYARTRWPEPLDRRFAWELIEARDPIWHARAAVASSRECDVFLSTNSYLTVGLLRIPAVAIVYDMIAFEPAMHPNRRSAVIERLTLGWAVRAARGLLCISQATADALVARFPAAAAKVSVAPLGVSPALSMPTAEELAELPPEGFVLAVGTLEPRKNLPRLVAAYAALPGPHQEAHPLVVVGARGWDTGPTLTALRSLGDRCMLLGRVSDGALAELYRRCAIFCYPSLGEGFGLPVLEAMAAGAPVLTAANSSLPELGSSAVEYADARDVASIAAGLERLLSSPERRAALGALAKARAAEFSWARTAEITLTALEQATRC